MLVAAIQMNSQDNKEKNVQSAENLIDIAAEKGARLVVLPEHFNYLGLGERKPADAEEIPGPTTQRMMDKATQHGVFVIA